jgi:hypothetical protein
VKLPRRPGDNNRHDGMKSEAVCIYSDYMLGGSIHG